MFSDNPVLIALTALLLFIFIGPAIVGFTEWRRRKKLGAGQTQEAAPAQTAEPATTRFMGTQLDLAILLMGMLLVVGAATWIYKAFAR
jgi:hypothetical protein